MGVVILVAEARASGFTFVVEGDSLIVRGPHTDSHLIRQLRESKAEVMKVLTDEEAVVAWRVALFRATLPQQGPIWPPKLRNTPKTDTPGHCSICGDSLPTDPALRFPRCQPCMQALWRVLDEREGEA